jgi:AcrR family transcriptional regulator
MRDRIKAAATELFIRHGLASLSLGAVADQVGMSRPAIHYHFKTKARLAEEVLEEYARINLDHSRSTWLDPKVPLGDKFAASLEFTRQRYLKYNPSGKGDRPWSLFARIYQESDHMTAAMAATLRNAAQEQQTYFHVAVEMAVVRGELVADTPASEVALQLVGLVNQAGWFTWTSSGFSTVERLYRVTLDSLQRAWGVKEAPKAAVRRSARAGGTARSHPVTDT